MKALKPTSFDERDALFNELLKHERAFNERGVELMCLTRTSALTWAASAALFTSGCSLSAFCRKARLIALSAVRCRDYKMEK